MQCFELFVCCLTCCTVSCHVLALVSLQIVFERNKLVGTKMLGINEFVVIFCVLECSFENQLNELFGQTSLHRSNFAVS